jgi:lipoate-protein ligase A
MEKNRQPFIPLRLDPPSDGYAHMEADRELLEQATKGLAAGRVYTWQGPWVSLGRFQKPEKDLLPSCEVPWVPRPTGGRAVLHGHDITVALALPLILLAQSPEELPKLSRSVKLVYRNVIHPLVESLRECGIRATLAEKILPTHKSPRSADCFAHISPNDIVEEQTCRKICGCALRLTDQAVLLQASIPVTPPLVNPRSVFLSPATYFFSSLELSCFHRSLKHRLGY